MNFIFKMFLLSVFLINNAFAADPDLKITAPVASLKLGVSTTVTFTFTEPVTGFTLSDVNIKGNGQFLTGLTGSGAVYEVNFQKTVDNNAVSLVVDNNAATPAGHGATIGFNHAPKIYIKDGGIFNNKVIEAVPQPECPRVGEILVDANNLPATPVVENYYIFSKTTKGRRALGLQQIRQGCLTRLINGQKFVKKVLPKSFESNNVHGGHHHSSLMPKVTQQYIQPIVGTTKTRVKPHNLGACSIDGSGVYDCGGEGAWRSSNLPAKVDFDDPIVFPNIKGAAHAHVFYGNNAVNYQTNTVSLVKNCSSSFPGGVANCTGYWMPAFIDTATDTAIMPDSIGIYYKAGDNAHIGLVEPVPQGLKIIAGNPAATSAAGQTDSISFSCESRDGSPILQSSTLINCSGDKYRYIKLSVDFPFCVADNGFGGMQLDSTNHRSHLIPANLVAPRLPNGCTSAFPHRIPFITQIAGFPIEPGQNTATWRLSSDNYSAALPGAASAHADWWGGWKTYWINRIVDQCNNKVVDCGVDYVGLNDGVSIASITTVGNVATITTTVPHLLKTSLGNGNYPEFVGNSATQQLMGRISGVTGVDAAAYNFDASKLMATRPGVPSPKVIPTGSQGLKILNATQIEYTLNYTPTDTNVVLTNAKLQWGELFCGISDPCGGNQSYSDFYYGDKQ